MHMHRPSGHNHHHTRDTLTITHVTQSPSHTWHNHHRTCNTLTITHVTQSPSHMWHNHHHTCDTLTITHVTLLTHTQMYYMYTSLPTIKSWHSDYYNGFIFPLFSNKGKSLKYSWSLSLSMNWYITYTLRKSSTFTNLQLKALLSIQSFVYLLKDFNSSPFFLSFFNKTQELSPWFY